MVGHADYPDCVYCSEPISSVYKDGDIIVFWCGSCQQGIEVVYE